MAAESPENAVVVKCAEDVEVDVEILSGSDLDHSGSNSSSNNDNSSAHKSFSRVNTLPAGKLSSDRTDPDLSPAKLGRSKTERQQQKNILASEAAQIFDNKISAQQKLKLLNRIATVKDDGTVEFEVP